MLLYFGTSAKQQSIQSFMENVDTAVYFLSLSKLEYGRYRFIQAKFSM